MITIPPTTQDPFAQISAFATSPYVVYLLPEVFVIVLALVYRKIGDKENHKKVPFWRVSGKLVSGGIGMIIAGFLLTGSRAAVVHQTGTAEAKAFVDAFEIVSWLVATVAIACYFAIAGVARACKGKKPLLLDPILPDVAAVFYIVGASWIWMLVVTHI